MHGGIAPVIAAAGASFWAASCSSLIMQRALHMGDELQESQHPLHRCFSHANSSHISSK